ncbi:hypothetical protein AXF42_Ash020078 [Apostasia shenzhenica]|uniref:Metallo-beta-lactamase domain-containing protein n=1 Tax=Apostasia shenzhenica TaxID=1088818 RepID=A0A2I0APS6_9ASPA|nr:hypothetical protein AXF42_Ash020078 [Apostasia shenzhenica]
MLMASSLAFHMAFRPPSMTINRAVPPDHPLLSFSSSRRRHRRLSFLPSKCHALRASSSSVSSVNPGATEDSIMLTYLEGNSWLWNFEGVKALVDPILVGNLDFGVPWLYDASKKVLTSFRIEDVPELDCLLITQSLDDHCHIKTLKPLAEMFPDLPVFSTPNAEFILSPLFKNVSSELRNDPLTYSVIVNT